jgi:hypothetical protein
MSVKTGSAGIASGTSLADAAKMASGSNWQTLLESVSRRATDPLIRHFVAQSHGWWLEARHCGFDGIVHEVADGLGEPLGCVAHRGNLHRVRWAPSASSGGWQGWWGAGLEPATQMDYIHGSNQLSYHPLLGAIVRGRGGNSYF